MTSEHKKMVDKVNKMLALAGSTSTHEAAVALKMASDLMQEHQITEADLALAQAKDDTIECVLYQVPDQAMRIKWLDWMAQAAAETFDCRILLRLELHCHKVYFVGHKHDIELSIAMFDHLVKTQRSIVLADLANAKQASKGLNVKWTPKATMDFKQGHGHAFSVEVFSRCQKMVKDRKEAVRSASSTGRELIVVKTAKVEEKVQEIAHKGKKRKGKAPSTGSAAGQTMGYKAGRDVPLGGAITDTKKLGE